MQRGVGAKAGDCFGGSEKAENAAQKIFMTGKE
jgi:hypothetical protein